MRLRRKSKGSLMAEFTANIYVLFIFLVFPLLDISVLGFRSFFLWFAANQAVGAACKAKTYLQPVDVSISGSVRKKTYPSACDLACSKANEVKDMFSGIHWEESDNNPDVQIVREPINPKDREVEAAKIFTRGHGAPLGSFDTPDSNRYVYTCRVIIKGQVDPLVTFPFFKIPGLSGPIDMTVSSQAEFENLPGLIK